MTDYRYSHKGVSISLTIIALVTLLFIACGPKPAKKIQPNTPFNLKATAGDRSGTLDWQMNRDKSTPISGYNIYLAKSADTEGELVNSGPFPGDTDGDITRETYELSRLENGERYYAYVRTVMIDGSLSDVSGRVSFIPLLRGKLEISTNHATSESGYSFAKEKYTPARDFDNDFYIYATREKAGISSPSRLHSSLRESLIDFRLDKASKFEQTKPLTKGKTYIIKTADGGSAHLTLLKFSGGPGSVAIFDYIYYPPGVEP
ncbi:MAG: fibronectin type III domain-containing protein [candidate division Zixibacteria bacterium]|nr:fibronectin type III domain-containing protein [candidate division Zixibacteria bacterium]